MNLDDQAAFTQLDSQKMIDHIDSLPDQLLTAWDLGETLGLPTWTGIRQILISGMGGSAIGADLLGAYAEARCTAPIIVQRDYSLPAWVNGPETLVIASSHSGNTEETLSVFEQALERNCCCLAITTGGQLAERAAAHGVPTWNFEHQGQPRAAVGFSFGLLLAALVRLGLMPDPQTELQAAVAAMRAQQDLIKIHVPTVQNPAKRMAGQMVERWVVVLGSGLLAPVARRWKGQVNEIAKAWAQFELVPEANHNTQAGILNPQELFSQMVGFFLRAPSDHPRNALRLELTRKSFMLEGIPTDFWLAKGDSPLAHQWTTLHFGDYLTYYLAMAYGMDPTPVEAIETLKAQMAEEG